MWRKSWCRYASGRLTSKQRWLAVALAMAPGCGATFEQLQTRAALDLDCQSQAISARQIDGSTELASGCGKEAIYVQTCAGKDHTDCTWMLNSAIKPATTSVTSSPTPTGPPPASSR